MFAISPFMRLFLNKTKCQNFEKRELLHSFWNVRVYMGKLYSILATRQHTLYVRIQILHTDSERLVMTIVKICKADFRKFFISKSNSITLAIRGEANLPWSSVLMVPNNCKCSHIFYLYKYLYIYIYTVFFQNYSASIMEKILDLEL